MRPETADEPAAERADSPATKPAAKNPRHTMLAVVVAAVMLIFALSIWTVIPLGWIWIGSQLAATQFPSTGPYIVVFVGIVITILGIAWVIGRLNEIYVSLTGTATVAPLRSSWLKSMRDTPAGYGHAALVEVILILSVILATAAFAFWFFLYAGSPIGNA
ncbi:MAG TPA: hypothetical protein VFD37_04160 [Solirubrobacterales bacterium]|nr:hypothetical protein [Solirubrobacterales bacterium]